MFIFDTPPSFNTLISGTEMNQISYFTSKISLSLVSAQLTNISCHPHVKLWLYPVTSACGGLYFYFFFHRSGRTDLQYTQSQNYSDLIYIVLFRSRALLTLVTPPAGLSKQLSGLRFVFCYVELSAEQIFLMKEQNKKVNNGCKINDILNKYEPSYSAAVSAKLVPPTFSLYFNWFKNLNYLFVLHVLKSFLQFLLTSPKGCIGPKGIINVCESCSTCRTTAKGLLTPKFDLYIETI